MTIVLGVDAAWTAREPSGVALLMEESGRWRCAAVAPSYESFLSFALGTPVKWDSPRFTGRVPQPAALLGAVRALAGDASVEFVAVDMPLATAPIISRRVADDAVSKAFGRFGCGTHTPSAARPGRIADDLRLGFEASGISLATTATSAGTARRLIEVYPHPGN